MIEIETAKTILRADEGFREIPYYDTEGYPTGGYGFKLGKKGNPLPVTKFTLEESNKTLHQLCCELSTTLMRNKTYKALDVVRRATLLSMAYQMGMTGLYGFKKMWAALEAKDYETAAKECLDSKAARQAPNRFKRNAAMIESGILHAYYR